MKTIHHLPMYAFLIFLCTAQQVSAGLSAQPSPTKKLWKALIDNNPIVMQQALDDDADVNGFCSTSRYLAIEENPLLFAAARGRLSAMTLLLDHGAYVNVKDKDNHWTPLMVAVIQKYPVKMIGRLIQKGADLNCYAKDGSTALTFACINDDPITAQFLIESGATENIYSNPLRLLSDQTMQQQLQIALDNR